LRDAGIGNAHAEVMDGQDVKLPDGSFDVALSDFAVILFPDIERGLAEMHRVLESGGRIALSAWSVLSFIFDALGPEKTRRVQEVLVQQLQDDFKDGDVRLPNEGLIAFVEK
jgi:ubiquinone/menaquinone biosynthesis C-methylase UbiE